MNTLKDLRIKMVMQIKLWTNVRVANDVAVVSWHIACSVKPFLLCFVML